MTGDIPYTCNGTPAQCAAVLKQLQQFSKANGFNLTFHPATTSERLSGLVSDRNLDIQFGPEQEPDATGRQTVGKDFATGNNMVLYGNTFANFPQVADHEFVHWLGLNHDEPPWGIDQLMYPTAMITNQKKTQTPITLWQGDRDFLLKMYAQKK